jgi:hypothetical protein
MRSLGLISADKRTSVSQVPNLVLISLLDLLSCFPLFYFVGCLFQTMNFSDASCFSYDIQLWQLTPNSILHLAIFITLCEAFLGIDPHWGLWKKIYFVKRYSGGNGPDVAGVVGLLLRRKSTISTSQ